MASLKEKTLKGTFWTFIEQFSVKGLGFVVQIILARLLIPEDFGLIAMVAVFIGIGNALVDSGMNLSLIRTKNPNQKDFSSIFYLNVVISFIFYGLIFFISPLIADFFNQPQLEIILRCIALVVPIKSFMIVQKSILTINMDFKSQMLIQLPSLVISGIVAIILAYLNFGVWALVFMQLITAILVSIQYWFYSKWRPLFLFDRERLKYHFNFGYKLMLTTLINALFNNIYNIIIAKYFSTTSLGLYNRASTYQKFPSVLIGRAINRVTYPLFSKLTNNTKKLRKALCDINKIVIYVYFPVMLFLIFNASDIVTVVLTEKWLGIVPFFQILCIGSLIQPIKFYNSNIIEVYGDTSLILKINVIFRLISILGIFILIPYGIKYLVIFESLNIFILVLVFIYYSGKFIAYSFKDQLTDILPEIALNVFVGAFCYFISNSLSFNSLFKIILSMVIYMSLYIFLSSLFRFSSYYEIIKIIKSVLKKIKSERIN